MVDRSGKEALGSNHTALLPADMVPLLVLVPIHSLPMDKGTLPRGQLLLPVGSAGNQDRRQRTKVICWLWVLAALGRA